MNTFLKILCFLFCLPLMGWGQEKSDLLLEFSPLKNSKIMEEGYNPFLSLHDTSFIMIVDAGEKNKTNSFYYNEHLYKFPQEFEFFSSFYEENKEKIIISCVYDPDGITLNKYKIENQNLKLLLSKKTEEVLALYYSPLFGQQNVSI